MLENSRKNFRTWRVIRWIISVNYKKIRWKLGKLQKWNAEKCFLTISRWKMGMGHNNFRISFSHDTKQHSIVKFEIGIWGYLTIVNLLYPFGKRLQKILVLFLFSHPWWWCNANSLRTCRVSMIKYCVAEITQPFSTPNESHYRQSIQCNSNYSVYLIWFDPVTNTNVKTSRSKHALLPYLVCSMFVGCTFSNVTTRCLATSLSVFMFSNGQVIAARQYTRIWLNGVKTGVSKHALPSYLTRSVFCFGATSLSVCTLFSNAGTVRNRLK